MKRPSDWSLQLWGMRVWELLSEVWDEPVAPDDMSLDELAAFDNGVEACLAWIIGEPEVDE